MEPDNRPRIRAAQLADLDVLYDICLRTGEAGEDASHLYSDPRLLGEIYVAPYVGLDNGFGVVIEDSQGVGGYCVAAPDTPRFEQECETVWWPPLRQRHPDPGPDPKNDDEWCRDYIHRPHLTPPEVVKKYLAHLHISLLPRLQGQGMGRAIITRVLDELRSRGVAGVHLGVEIENRRAIGFYQHLGFRTFGARQDETLMGLPLQIPAD